MANLISWFKKAPESSAKVEPKQRKKAHLLIPLGVLLVGTGLGVAYFLSQPKTESSLQLSGRIEGYETDVGTKVAGRVESVSVREGNEVSQGQILVKLDDEEVEAQLEGVKAELIAAQKREKQAQLQIDVLQSKIRQAELNLQQTTEETAGRIEEAKANLAATQAQLVKAQAALKEARSELNLAKVERDRYQQLLEDGAVPQDTFDQAQTRWEKAQANLELQKAEVDAARKQVIAAQGILQQAQTSRLNPEISSAELDSLRKQLIQAESQLEVAQSEIAKVKAQQKEIEARLGYLNIVSPIAGVVIARSVEPGEVVTTGKTLLSLIDLNNVYLRGYIPEGEIGKVRVGQKARVYLDSYPDRPFNAKVTEIDTQASFTPENIYFPEDRVKQVFGVKLDIENPDGFAKPGMPADAEIILAGEEEGN
ncbi:MAG: HlyD family efflux transporter periplasmic adaptor subunit [Cyanobacteria bacterium J083]|nr:MAG: HlyD family efflux transporter periplasmic adaptor subunit [Cyanobacteria bacterium J083]